jgi:hypothetical protein
MKLAEPDKLDEFLTENGFGELLGAEQMPGKSLLQYSFEAEDHTRSVYPIAKYLTNLSQGKQRTLVRLDNMCVWPSGRDEYLIRHAFSSMLPKPSERLIDGTAILWESGEEDAAATLYHMALWFGWDAYIFPLGLGESAFISHDGFVELHTDSDPSFMAESATKAISRAFIILDE